MEALSEQGLTPTSHPVAFLSSDYQEASEYDTVISEAKEQ
jgi:hypothetical protein